MEKNTCPICGDPTAHGVFCDDCERKIDKRFPGGEWEMMEIEDIRAALLTENPAETPSAPVSAAPAFSGSKRKQKAPASSAKHRSAAKKKEPSSMKRIVPGILLLAILAWIAPQLAGEWLAFRNAPEKQEVQAGLDSYEWSWDSDKEQYRIEARYRWTMGGSSGTVSETQYKSPAFRSLTSRTGLTHKGKDGDPAEVRPYPSVKVKLFQKPDGKWRPAPTQGIKDSLSLIGGLAATFAFGIWLIISGLLIWMKKRK